MEPEPSGWGSQEEADLRSDRLASRGGEVVSLCGVIGHVSSYRLHHVVTVTAAALAELGADAALHVGPGQRQEGDEASDEILLDDAGQVEPTWGERRVQDWIHCRDDQSGKILSHSDIRKNQHRQVDMNMFSSAQPLIVMTSVKKLPVKVLYQNILMESLVEGKRCRRRGSTLGTDRNISNT